jgi:hypothetical protein
MLSDLTHLDSIHQPVAAPLPLADKGIARPESGPRTLFDGSQGAWCELVRDVVAIANSGGGELSVESRGDALNAESLAERLLFFTGQPHLDVSLDTVQAGARTISKIVVCSATVPLGFVRAGTYFANDGAGEPVEVFPAGGFYFRHGDVSAPGTTDDMQAFFRRTLRGVAREWLRGIRRVIGSAAVPLELAGGEPGGATRGRPQPVRIVTDPSVPALQPQDVERLYPLRQKDLVGQLNRRFGRRLVNSYDIQAVRRQHGLDERPDFVFHLPGAGRRYSHAAAEWFASQYEADSQFFQRARAADHETLMLRRKKPR